MCCWWPWWPRAWRWSWPKTPGRFSRCRAVGEKLWCQRPPYATQVHRMWARHGKTHHHGLGKINAVDSWYEWSVSCECMQGQSVSWFHIANLPPNMYGLLFRASLISHLALGSRLGASWNEWIAVPPFARRRWRGENDSSSNSLLRGVAIANAWSQLGRSWSGRGFQPKNWYCVRSNYDGRWHHLQCG